MRIPRRAGIHRRSFLKTGVASAVGLLGGGLSIGAASAADDKRYGGFKMGLQSYSLRAFSLDEMLAQMQTLELKYLEGFPKHLPVSTLPEYFKKQKEVLQRHGITLSAYGVVNFDANETKARELFDFAQGMGIATLSANPAKNKETFDLLDRLVAEYGVSIAIHNHGPGADYDKIDDVEHWVKDRHPQIGACVDTGHFLRSDEDPVEALERLGDRLYDVHLKDVKSFGTPQEADAFIKKHKSRLRMTNGNKVMAILGEGDLNLVGCLRVLKNIDYQHCLSLEYEENEQNPLPDIELCLSRVRRGVRVLDKESD